MKKSLLVVLFVLLAASMFAADVSVSIDAGVYLWRFDGEEDQGFQYRAPSTADESDFTSALSVAYDGESFGGSLEIRSEADGAPYGWEKIYSKGKFNMDEASNLLFVRNYNAYVKPCQEVKISIGTNSIELLGENISWEPLFAASIFENSSGAPSLQVQWDVDAHLTIYAGLDTNLVVDKKTDNRLKPWTGFAALASYEVFGVGKFIGKFESLENYLDDDISWDAGLAFQLLALDTQDVYAGYSILMDREEKFKPVQHRIEAFYGLNLDGLSISLFDSLELKTRAKEIQGKDLRIGNRVAFKAEYYWNNIIPSLSVNYYYNFGDPGHL